MGIDFSFNATSNTDDGTALSLIVGGALIKCAPPTIVTPFKFVFDDTVEKTYDVEIKMEGKIDPSTVITLNDLQFGQYVLDVLTLEDIMTYSHNFNGTGANVTEMYTSTLGCNGSIKFTFTTPLYTWLLDKVAK